MPQAYQSRPRTVDSVREDEAALQQRPPLNPHTTQLMVERLYTPDQIRHRRARADAQAALERRRDYSAVEDVHLQNFWSRQRHNKQGLRCFSRNTATPPLPPRSRSALSSLAVYHTSVMSDNATSGTALPPLVHGSGSKPVSPTANDKHYASGSQSRSLSPSTGQTSRSVSPSQRSACSDDKQLPIKPAVAHARDDDASAHYSEEYDDDFASSAGASPMKDEKRDEPPAGEAQRSPASSVASPATSPHSSPQHPQSDQKPAGNPTSSEAGVPSPSAEPPRSINRPPVLSMVALEHQDRREPEPILTDEDIGVLCMLVAPSQAFAASVRRLRLHEGIDLAWIARYLPPPTHQVSLHSIPFEAPDFHADFIRPRGSTEHSPNAAQSPEAKQTDPSADPTIAGEEGRSPSAQPMNLSSRRAQPHPAGVEPPTPELFYPRVNSPRSAHILLRNGVCAVDLWPIPRDVFYRHNVHQGVARTVLKHRFEVHETGRQDNLRWLQQQYEDMCSQVTSAAVRAAIDKHRDDGLMHDPTRLPPQVARPLQRRRATAQKQQHSLSPYDHLPHRAASTPKSGRMSARSSHSHGSTSRPADIAVHGKLLPSELHELRAQRLEEQFHRMADQERARTQEALDRHHRELDRDAAIAEQRRRESADRAEAARRRDKRIEKARTTAEHLRQDQQHRVEALIDYSDMRSDAAKQTHDVEVLADREYLKAVRTDREQTVTAHERQLEFEKLCVLHAAQQRESSVNAMLRRRAEEQKRMTNERRDQATQLRIATEKLKADLLKQKRKGLLPSATASSTLPPRAKSSMI
jgi:hypothetical protein